MSALSGTVVTDPVVPPDTTSINPTHYALYGIGGLREVADVVARDAIPSARRSAGMSVYVVADDITYRLGASANNTADILSFQIWNLSQAGLYFFCAVDWDEIR